MAIWIQLALATNVVCWAIFLYLLTRRRWSWGALAVGIFHMLYGGLGSVAPFRSVLDPDYATMSVGFLRFAGPAAALPSVVILSWAMAAAWLAIAEGRGRWMGLIALGDGFLALNIGGSILLDDTNNWKFQLGEYISITGVPGLLVLFGLLTAPLVACAIWAVNRTYSSRNMSPLAQNTRQEHAAANEDVERIDGPRYSETALARI